MHLENPGDSDLRMGDSGNGYAKAHRLTWLAAWILIRDGFTLLESPRGRHFVGYTSFRALG